MKISSLLKKGINLEVAAKKTGFTPLVVASLKGNVAGMKVCILLLVFFYVSKIYHFFLSC